MKINTMAVRFAAAIILVSAVVAVAVWYLAHPLPEILQGQVEATQIDVSAKIPGRVEALHVREGEHVLKGQLLVTLESPEVRAKLDQAKAAFQAAVAQRDKAFKGARDQEIDAAYNMWQAAQAAADLAQNTYGRIENVYKKGDVSDVELERARTQRDAVRDQAAAARQQYKLALAGARDEDKLSAEALVDQAAGVVREVEAALAETSLKAPIEGEVSELIVDPGEIVSAGYPIISLIDLQDIWITANLREDLLGDLKMGDTVTVRIPALKDKEVVLEVSYIAALADFATWRATSASGEFDLKTFEVRGRPLEPVEGLRPGMSAVVNLEKN